MEFFIQAFNVFPEIISPFQETPVPEFAFSILRYAFCRLKPMTVSGDDEQDTNVNAPAIIIPARIRNALNVTSENSIRSAAYFLTTEFYNIK